MARHLTVTRLDDEAGGVVVRVDAIAREGTDADVAKTGAWLQAHAMGVKCRFEANLGACGCTVCTVCAVYLWNTRF